MSLVVWGADHKVCPIETREKLSFSSAKIHSFLNQAAKDNIKSLLILSTCNRFEIYFTAKSGNSSKIESLLKQMCGKHFLDLKPFLCELKDKEALIHLCRVLSGADSQAIGETQIFGQVKAAYDIAIRDGNLDFWLTNAFRIAKETRKETKISEGNISVASIAASLIKRNIKPLQGKHLYIVGTGQISELLSKYLKAEGTKLTFVSNKNHARAEDLAGRYSGRTIRIDEFRKNISAADIIVTATASPHVLFKAEDFSKRKKPLLLIDLAVPRDIDPQVKELTDIRLFDLDDLKLVSEENLEKREQAAEKASEIIEKRVDSLWKEYLKLELEPVR